MSEYHVVEVEFKDEECLIEALTTMGLKPEVHENGTVITSGYARTKPKAHIVVRRSQFSGFGDLGFERIQNGFKMHVDDYDYRENGRDKIGMRKLKQCYAESTVKKVVRRTSRYSLVSRQEKEGKIKLKVRRLGV